jgi:phage gp36-like protein
VGEKLVALFDKADKLGGAKARMRMTMIAKITSIKANDLPDSPENVKALEDALKEIEKEFK